MAAKLPSLQALHLPTGAVATQVHFPSISCHPPQVRESYGRELVNLRNESRFIFLNTLFSVSEAVLYMQARACS